MRTRILRVFPTAVAMCCFAAGCSAVEYRKRVERSDAVSAIRSAFSEPSQFGAAILWQEVLSVDHVEGDLWCAQIRDRWQESLDVAAGPPEDGGACWTVYWADATDRTASLQMPLDSYLDRLAKEGKLPDYAADSLSRTRALQRWAEIRQD